MAVYNHRYNNQVFDLLQGDSDRRRPLPLRERAAKQQGNGGQGVDATTTTTTTTTTAQVFVQGLSEFNVTSLEEVRSCG